LVIQQWTDIVFYEPHMSAVQLMSIAILQWFLMHCMSLRARSVWFR